MRVYLLTSVMHHVNFHFKVIYYFYPESLTIIADQRAAKFISLTQKHSYGFSPKMLLS